MEHLQNADAANRDQPERLGLPEGFPFVDQYYRRSELLRKKNDAHFAGTETGFCHLRPERVPIPNRRYFNPRGVRRLARGGKTGPGDDHFVINFGRQDGSWGRPWREDEGNPPPPARSGKRNRRRRSQTETRQILPILFKFFQSVVERNAMAACKFDERFHRRAGQFRRPSERYLVFAEEKERDHAGSFGGKMLLV